MSAVQQTILVRVSERVNELTSAGAQPSLAIQDQTWSKRNNVTERRLAELEELRSQLDILINSGEIDE